MDAGKGKQDGGKNENQGRPGGAFLRRVYGGALNGLAAGTAACWGLFVDKKSQAVLTLKTGGRIACKDFKNQIST